MIELYDMRLRRAPKKENDIFADNDTYEIHAKEDDKYRIIDILKKVNMEAYVNPYFRDREASERWKKKFKKHLRNPKKVKSNQGLPVWVSEKTGAMHPKRNKVFDKASVTLYHELNN